MSSYKFVNHLASVMTNCLLFPNSVIPFLFACHIISPQIYNVASFTIHPIAYPTLRRSIWIKNSVSVFSSSIEDDESIEEMGGAEIFESWFRVNSKKTGKFWWRDFLLGEDYVENPTLSNLRHSSFRTGGRGLEYLQPGNPSEVTSESDVDSNGDFDLDDIGNRKDLTSTIAVIPTSLVLRSRIPLDRYDIEKPSDDWDASLAIQLLRECVAGRESKLSGYCYLLTRGKEFTEDSCKPCPPSTAPDALRNWSPSQIEYLLQTSPVRGQKLLVEMKKQEEDWTAKFESLPDEEKIKFSRKQFDWAMEAVLSRAFRGNFGNDPKVLLERVGLPIVLSVFTVQFFDGKFFKNLEGDLIDTVGGDGTDDTTSLLLNFALLAFILSPALIDIIKGKSKDIGARDAVLLPFIDSANHSEDAGSEIEYNPIRGEFTLRVVGGKCLEIEKRLSGEKKKRGGDSTLLRRQLYISYGEKSDSELLLNYGFLPKNAGIGITSSNNERRIKLADAYASRGRGKILKKGKGGYKKK